ncbi:hypothetical protein TNCV_1967841 [Trichonephila clavipes]|nr:hypothetical protein TNCV_1967841 [Trichonephila clavipes]
MITNFFIPELNNHDVQELGFQQDGATCHTARTKINLLKDTFGDRLISRFGPVNWPPRSCDLTPLDYFLWGYVKSLVYADKPQTLDHLEDNIRRVIADIRPQMLEKVIENWTTSEPAVAVICQKSYLKLARQPRVGLGLLKEPFPDLPASALQFLVLKTRRSFSRPTSHLIFSLPFLRVPIDWALKTFLMVQSSVHSDNAACPFDSLYFDEVNDVTFFI